MHSELTTEARENGESVEYANMMFSFVRDAGIAEAVLLLPIHYIDNLAEFNKLPVVSGDNVVPQGCSRCKIGERWIILMSSPVHHPDIFGNPAVASSFGFVRSPDGTWHVRPDCRR